MINAFLSQILDKTFAPTLRVVDAVGIVVPPAIGSFYWISGAQMPEGLVEAMGAWVIGGAVTVLLLRFVTSPYLIWRDDQKAIAGLKEKLNEPRRLARESLRAEFTKDRAALLKKLLAIQSDMRRYNEAANVGVETAQTLYESASPFLAAPEFKTYWFTFEKNLKACSALHAWRAERSPLSEADEHRSLLRYSLHHTLIYGALDGMTIWLAAEDGHWEAYKKIVDQIDLYEGVDLTFALPPRAGFNEIDWFLGDDWSPPSDPPKPV